MLIGIVAILIFLLAGFFSASETALTVVSKARVFKLAKEDHEAAKIAAKLLDRTDHAISSLLIGTALIHLISAALVGGWSSHVFSPTTQALIAVGYSSFIIIFCDMLPKMFALNYPEPILFYMPKFLNFMVFICTPINKIVKFIARIILKILNLHEGQKKSEDIDELKSYIDLHYSIRLKEKGEERIMLRSVLDLDLLSVEDVMIHRTKVKMLNITASLEEILEFIQEFPFTRIPVYDKDLDEIKGILNVRTVLGYCFSDKQRQDFNLASLLSTPWFISSYTDLLDQLLAFRSRQEHFAIIVDEYGSCIGIITLEDILEEIVGDIEDELDKKKKQGKEQESIIVHCTDGTFLVPGRYNIRDLNRQLNIELPADHAVTVSGMIMKTAQKIPAVGERFVIHDVTFEIIKATRRFISSVKITLPNKELQGVFDE